MPDVSGCGLLCSWTIDSFKEGRILLLPICPIVSILGIIVATEFSIIMLIVFVVTQSWTFVMCFSPSLITSFLIECGIFTHCCRNCGFVKQFPVSRFCHCTSIGCWTPGCKCCVCSMCFCLRFSWPCTSPAATLREITSICFSLIEAGQNGSLRNRKHTDENHFVFSTWKSQVLISLPKISMSVFHFSLKCRTDGWIWINRYCNTISWLCEWNLKN